MKNAADNDKRKKRVKDQQGAEKKKIHTHTPRYVLSEPRQVCPLTLGLCGESR